MNKLTKAAIAGGVGIALLLGGAGTLATWNSSSNISGGTIVAGNLVVGTPATGAWAVSHLLTGSTTTYSAPVSTTLAAFKASPGDKLIYTTTVPITAVGTNLVATLALSGGAIAATPAVPATDPVPTVNAALAAYLSSNAVLTATGTSISGSGTGPYTVTAGNNGIVAQDVVFTATITFPRGAAADDNKVMLGSVNLSQMAFTLTQNS